MNLTGLQTLVSSWLDDVSNTYFTLPQITVWLNNAQREVQKELLQAGENWYLVEAQTNTIANSDAYALPSDFLQVHRIQIVTSGTAPNQVTQTVGPATPMQLSSVFEGPGTPYAYYMKKLSLVLRPIPDMAYAMQMLYSYIVSDMVNPTDTPDVAVQYQEYVAVIAAIDGFLKDQRDPSPFFSKRDSYRALMKQASQDRKQDYPRMVVVNSEMGFDYNW